MMPRRKWSPAVRLGLLYPALGLAVATAQTVAERAGEAGGLARYVPPSAGLMIEIVDLSLLQRQSEGSPLWRTALRMMGLESGAGEGGSICEQLGLSHEEAVSHVFGRDVAVALPQGGRAAEGVLLARLGGSADLRVLLRGVGWSRETRPGGLRWYTSATGLRLATDGRTVIVGHALQTHPFLDSCAQLLREEGAGSLADSAEFARLTEGLPRRAVGIAYLSRFMEDSGNDSTGPGEILIPRWLRRAALAMEATSGGARFHFACEPTAGRYPELLGSGGRADGAAVPDVSDALARITMGSSVGHILSYLDPAPAAGPRSLVAQLLRTGLGGAGPDDELLGLFEGPTTLIVAPPGGGATGGGNGPGVPRVALVMPSRDPAESVRALDAAMEKLVRFVNLLRASGMNPGAEAGELRIEREKESDNPARYISLAPLASVLDPADPNREVQISWGRAGDSVVIATDVTLTAVIRSAPRERGALQEGRGLEIRMRPGRLAGLATVWLDYAAERGAEILQDDWWSLIQARSGTGRAELGAGLRRDPDEPGKVAVVRTMRGYPADGVLEPGDRILGVGGRLLSLEDPLEELRGALGAEDGEMICLRIERAGRMRDVSIRWGRSRGWGEMTENPVEALGPMLTMARRVDSIRASIWNADDLIRGIAEIEWAAPPQVTPIGPPVESNSRGGE